MVLELGNVWIWTSLWSFTNLLLGTAYFSVFIFSQFFSKSKEYSVSKDGSFVCGNISVL